MFRALEPRAVGEPRVVVLKRMLPHIANESNAQAMFAEEARLASHVTHPNVVHVLGHGEIEGQPYLTLEYVPDAVCVELKSLKLYVWSYRDEGAFHEAVTNRILADLVEATAPRFMRLTADFNVRGGIYTTVVAEHRAAGWRPSTAVQLP